MQSVVLAAESSFFAKQLVLDCRVPCVMQTLSLNEYFKIFFLISLLFSFRYHFFLQVKRDILEGRLHCPRSTAALLASYAVQCK